MSDNKIKISADTSSIKKSLLDLSSTVKDLGKSKVVIFDKAQKDFISKEARKHMKDIEDQINKNNSRIIATNKLLNTEGRTLKQNLKTRQAMTNMMKKQMGLQKDLNKIQTLQSGVQGGGGGMMGRMKGGMGKGMSAMGLGGISRFLGPIGLALGALGGVASRGKKASNTFRGGIDDRMALRGRGVGDMNLNDKEGAASVGLNAQSMRRSRLSSMDVFGQAGATQSAVMQRSAFEKNFGIQQGSVSELGQGVSQTLGGADANKAMMTIQASLIASGISDEIGPYLETAANMLTTINEKGITFNDSAMGLLADLASQEGVAAERVGRLSTGVDSAIRGSSGESNAFFQQVFSQADIGGGSLGGIQAAIRSGGLFGANTSADALISGSDKDMFKRTGIGGQNMQGIADQTLKTLDTLFPSREGDSQTQQDDKRLQRLDFVRRTFGLQSEVEAANVEQLLKSAQSGTKSEQEVKAELTKMQQGNSELGNLQLINKSMAGQTRILQDIHQAVLDEAGENLAPLFNSIDKTMMKLDATLSAMMGFFGITTDQQKAQDAVTGDTMLDEATFKQATMGDKKKEKQFRGDLREQFASNEKSLSGMDDIGPVSPRLDPVGFQKWEKKQKLMSQQKNIKGTSTNLGIPLSVDEDTGTGKYVSSDTPGLSTDLGKQLSQVMGQMNVPAVSSDNRDLVNVMRETMTIQKRSAKANETTAKNSKAKGMAKNATPRE